MLVRVTNTKTFPISSLEQELEEKLREHFARFWSTAAGTPREIYDAFISGCPLVNGVSLESVDRPGLRGWWVHPAQGQPGRAILFLHGGGYVVGSAKAYRGFVSQIVDRSGVPAFIVEYPLAPEASLPAAPAAALVAWAWLVEQGFKQIAIVGDSAGGGLSLVTLQSLAQSSNGVMPVAGVVFSPWTDLSFSGASMTDTSLTDPLISYEYLQNCARGVLGGRDARDPLASPLFGDPRGLPPLLIQVGTDERLLDDSIQYAARAAQAGVPVQLEIWEGMHHVFQLDVTHLESSRTALDHAAGFLAQAFGS